MKTDNFMHLMAAAVIFAGMVTFTSCNKDDFELPEVIESEVLDQGLSEEIKTETTEQGTKLSYESWIMVKGQTRAAFENKVSVTLNCELVDVEAEDIVWSWDVETYKTSISNKSENQTVDGFVTVTDSILVYTVAVGGFSFDYNLKYQVASYDDHITKQVMPYMYYSNIKDNGGYFEYLDSYSDGQYIYSNRIYHHSISVDFGGNTYIVKANVLVERAIGEGNSVYILRSKVIDKSVEYSASENAYISSIKLSSSYSDGTTKEEVYSIPLSMFAEGAAGDPIKVRGNVEDVKFIEATITEVDRNLDASDVQYIQRERISENCILSFNCFDLVIPFIRYEAIFDNGVLTEKMLGCSVQNRVVRVKDTRWDFIEENDLGRHYYLDLTVEMILDQVVVEGKYTGWFLFE